MAWPYESEVYRPAGGVLRGFNKPSESMDGAEGINIVERQDCVSLTAAYRYLVGHEIQPASDPRPILSPRLQKGFEDPAVPYVPCATHDMWKVISAHH